MSLRFLSCVFAVSLALSLSSSCSAQTSAYGAVSLVNYCLNQDNSTSCKADTFGWSVGATHLFSSSSRLKAGIDGRFDESPGSKGGAAGLVAVRFAFVPERNPVSPYFQVGGGVETTTYSSLTCTTSAFSSTCVTNPVRKTGGAVAFAVGFNVRAGEHLFLRPLELMTSAGGTLGHVSVGTAVGYTF